MKIYFKPIAMAAAALLILQSCSMDEDRLNNQVSPADNET